MSRILFFIIAVVLTGYAVVVLVHPACIAHFVKFYIHEPVQYLLIPEIVLLIIIIGGGIQKGWYEIRQ